MAQRSFAAIPGGRVVRDQRSHAESRCRFVDQAAPRWYRKALRNSRRRMVRDAIRSQSYDSINSEEVRDAAIFW